MVITIFAKSSILDLLQGSEYAYLNDLLFQISFFNLDPNKAHGHEMINICMIQLCGISICKPLETIFQNCLRLGKFPSKWKKANVVLIFKSQNLRDQQVVLVTIPNCPNFFSVFRYQKDMISCEIFSKFFLRFWSYDRSKFSQFLGGLPFLLFFQTLGKFFQVQQLCPKDFLLFSINTHHCVVLEPKINMGKCCCMKEATRNQDFLQFGDFLSLNISKKQQDPKIFFECENQGPSRLSNYTKRSMGTAC